MKNFLIGLAVSVLVIFSALGGAIADRLFVIKPLDGLLGKRSSEQVASQRGLKIISDQEMVVNVAEKVSPSVVTVSISKDQVTGQAPFFDPFGVFGMMPQAPSEMMRPEKVQHDIGSGFIVGADGLIVTNKHVVSDLRGEYKVITKDNTEYQVKKIFRDPVVDLAILKIEPIAGKNLQAIDIGDSGNLKVGQFVVAIGTALGEFRHTVTTGVISGLGRGITAGDFFGQGGEELDNVIQTDAAINPGNSGGPLLNSAGLVIGVNVAMAGGAQNIGFAIPINTIKDALKNFKDTGQFSRPFLGVRYQMIPKETALMNDVPEGAYVVEVVADSPAEKAGLKKGDIIVAIGGEKLKDVNGGLAAVIGKHKVGEKVEVEFWRNKATQKATVSLEEAK